MSDHAIHYLSLSQEDLIKAGAFDLRMAIDALQKGLLAYKDGRILFPDKIVQIFKQETQERINCLPATLCDEKICGVKWVSVFPENPRVFGQQNLSAIIVLSSIVNGFPVAVMEGTLCSNMRVAAMGATAAQFLSREDSESIGFIGAGEQAKMHLLGMKAVRPGLKLCRVSSKYPEEEETFIRQLSPYLPDMEFVACGGNNETAIRDSDIIVCDDWHTVIHRGSQTVARVYNEGLITEDAIYGNITEILDGTLPGRENDKEFIYFTATGLAYADMSIAYAMYEKALAAGVGHESSLQDSMIFEKEDLKIRV